MCHSPNSVETCTGSDETVNLSIEYPTNTFTRVTWNAAGATSGVVTDCTTGTAAFVMPFAIPSHTKFRIAAYQVWTGAGRAISTGWSNSCDRSNGDEYAVGTGVDNTMNNTVLGTGLSNCSGPISVRAASNMSVTAILGDSTFAGVNDVFFDPGGGRGYVGRGAVAVGPTLNMSIPGDQATKYLASHDKRLAVMQSAGVTSVILGLGINDLNNGRTAAQLLTDRAAIRSYIPSAIWLDSTLTPTSSSTDLYKTAANQSIANAGNNTQRVSFNTTLRTTSVSARTLDLASYAETSPAFETGPIQDGGVWIPQMIITSAGGAQDGIHGNSMFSRGVAQLVANALATVH